MNVHRATQVEIVKANAVLIPVPNRGWLQSLALVVLAVALVAVAGMRQARAAAEGTPRFISMAVSVMPEYDQPRVLVSYRGEFDADVSLPLQASLRLPADASIEHVCSIKLPEEEHLCQPYTVEPDGPYLALTWEAITPTMYVEIYYGSISGAGQRSLEFTFIPPYPVQNLDLLVLEPMDATDFTLSPEPADIVEEQGFRHHTYSFQDLSADDPLSIEIAYARQTDQPSAPPRAAAAADDSGGIPQGVIFSLGLAGAGVLAFVLYRVFFRRFRIHAVALSSQAPEDEGAAPQRGAFFCRHCGGRVMQGSAFCPACGQEVRSPPEEQG